MKLFPTTACALALGLSLSGAQAQSTPGAGSTAAPPSTAAVDSDPIAPGGHWNVAAAQCRALLGESDDDRAAIGMFYYGYLAAKLNRNIIDTSRIENDLRHVLETCHQQPDTTIVAAFRRLREKNR
jgi:HdeA/HdeB family protein